MSVKNTSGTVFIRENTLLPTGLAVETELFLPGWRVVSNLDGYGLGRKVEEANWNFFYLAGDLKAVTLGRKGPGTLRKVVRRMLGKPGGERFNSLEITKVVSERFLGIPFTRVTAHFRHIQQEIGLQDRANDFVWRVSSSPNGEAPLQPRGLISSSQDDVGEMKMKTIRSSTLCLFVMLLVAPLLCAQDLSKYREFSFGMSPAAVVKLTDTSITDVKTLHRQPALIQELTWWLPMLPGASYKADSVREILFSFYNGELYKISATYDRAATEGLTAADLAQSISAKYGPPIDPVTEIDLSTGERHGGAAEKVVAHWGNAQYSLSLYRSGLANGFTLEMYSQQTNSAADVAIAKAIKVEELEGPQKEADRQKKEADELALERLKNMQSFRP
jgi:hypothetical protein